MASIWSWAAAVFGLPRARTIHASRLHETCLGYDYPVRRAEIGGRPQARLEVENAAIAGGRSRVSCSRIDPSRFRSEVRNSLSGERDLQRWMKDLGAALVINGSYYSSHTPVTPFLSNGEIGTAGLCGDPWGIVASRTIGCDLTCPGLRRRRRRQWFHPLLLSDAQPGDAAEPALIEVLSAKISKAGLSSAPRSTPFSRFNALPRFFARRRCSLQRL